MAKYRIVKWHNHQHYKDRCPPWIKLHHSLLTSEIWVMGDDATRALTIASMLLAARNDANDGTFNGDPEYVRRFGYLNTEPNFKPLIDYGFIELLQDASNPIAKCNTEKSREETEIDISTLKIVPKKRKPIKTTISDSFTISEAVKNWAEANGHSRLQERLSHFINTAKAKGYEYADWDAAFRNAISDDWAKLGKAPTKEKFNMDEFLKGK